MRLVRFGPAGREELAVLVGEHVVPVAEFAPDLATATTRQVLAEGRLGELADSAARLGPGGLPRASVRLGPPVGDPGKVVCVGLNYRGHASEQGIPWPEEPLLFAKAPSALCGCRDDIRLPVDTNACVDYEVELALVIGRRCTAVDRERALEHVAGYMVANDVTARRWQKDDGQWFRAKSCDTFYPCGPALVTRDEVADYTALRLTCEIDGERLQDDTPAGLIHDVPAILAWASRDMTLEPGDIVSTGTPAGVGCYREPKRFLRAGQTVTCAIDALGELVNRVTAA